MWEYEGQFEVESEKTMKTVTVTVQINKVGGAGVIGDRYMGSWEYRVTNTEGQEMIANSDLRVGLPKTHRQMAKQAAEWAVHYRDYPEGY